MILHKIVNTTYKRLHSLIKAYYVILICLVSLFLYKQKIEYQFFLKSLFFASLSFSFLRSTK